MSLFPTTARRGVFNKPSKVRWHSFCEWHGCGRLYRLWYFLVWWRFRKYPLCDPPYRSQIEGWTTDRFVPESDQSKWRMWLKMHPKYQ